MSITIVATSHIAKQSIDEVEKTILEKKPDCVAVELDSLRYRSFLEHNQSSKLDLLKNLGISTFLVVWIFKKLQNWLGSKVGILPGSEMLKAIEIAKKNNIKIALIDQDIRITLDNIKKIPLKEKVKLISYLIKAPIFIKFSSNKEKIDLSKTPSNKIIDQTLGLLRKEFPFLYKILIEDRNKYMATNIKKLKVDFEKIVIVVGAGHAKGLKQFLS